MYKITTEDDYDRSYSWYEKKKRPELRAVVDNLKKFLGALHDGAKLCHLHGKCIHREPLGVIAIGQEGHGRNLGKTRLYLYPSEEDESLHLIVIGDERDQSRDIELCKNVVRRIEQERRSITATPGILTSTDQESSDTTLPQEIETNDRDKQEIRERGGDGEGVVSEP